MPLISAYYGTHQASKAGRKKEKKKKQKAAIKIKHLAGFLSALRAPSRKYMV